MPKEKCGKNILTSFLAVIFVLFPFYAMATEEVISPVQSVRSLWLLLNIVFIIICITRRKKEIGGWLLFYYFQLYVGALFSILLLVILNQNYFPKAWGGISGLYIIFLLSTLPGIVIIFVELYLAERLRNSRKFEHMHSFCLALCFHFGIAIASLIIDLIFFKDNIPMAIISIISPAIWLPYFYRSKRVDRVFRTHDWISKNHNTEKLNNIS